MVWEVDYSLVGLAGVGEGVALTVLLMQMGIGGYVFEGVGEFVVDSRSLNSSSLIAKDDSLDMDIPMFVET